MTATRPPNDLLGQLRRAALRRGTGGQADGELLEAVVARRDEAAFMGLLTRHGPMVWGVCRRILGNAADAEDAFQATFLVLVRRAAAITPRTLVGNWLYGVAHHTALKAKAMNHKRRARERAAGQADRATAPPDEALLALLDQELSKLPDPYRAVVVLCDLEGKTRKEAARHLKWPEGTVAGRLVRARAMLGKRLGRHGV